MKVGYGTVSIRIGARAVEAQGGVNCHHSLDSQFRGMVSANDDAERRNLGVPMSQSDDDYWRKQGREGKPGPTSGGYREHEAFNSGVEEERRRRAALNQQYSQWSTPARIRGDSSSIAGGVIIVIILIFMSIMLKLCMRLSNEQDKANANQEEQIERSMYLGMHATLKSVTAIYPDGRELTIPPNSVINIISQHFKSGQALSKGAIVKVCMDRHRSASIVLDPDINISHHMLTGFPFGSKKHYYHANCTNS